MAAVVSSSRRWSSTRIGPCGVGTVPRASRRLPRNGENRARAKPGASGSGQTPRIVCSISIAGVTDQAWQSLSDGLRKAVAEVELAVDEAVGAFGDDAADTDD